MLINIVLSSCMHTIFSFDNYEERSLVYIEAIIFLEIMQNNTGCKNGIGIEALAEARMRLSALYVEKHSRIGNGMHYLLKPLYDTTIATPY